MNGILEGLDAAFVHLGPVIQYVGPLPLKRESCKMTFHETNLRDWRGHSPHQVQKEKP